MRPYRILLYSAVILFLILVAPFFERNLAYLINPSSVGMLASGHWNIVMIWIIAFSAFSLFLFYPRERGKWRKYSGIYIAYIIALFTEMFGFPLTLYFLSSFLPAAPLPEEQLATVLDFDFLGVHYSLLATSLVAGMVSVIGGILVVLGWKKVYNTERLVTDGIYAYSRHPQYAGMGMIIIAWLFAWPTIPTAVMGIVMLVVYYRLARAEERELELEFGEEYLDYRKRVPFLF